jgi:hypothetical protein
MSLYVAGSGSMTGVGGTGSGSGGAGSGSGGAGSGSGGTMTYTGYMPVLTPDGTSSFIHLLLFALLQI